jgi:hypothetical protein
MFQCVVQLTIAHLDTGLSDMNGNALTLREYLQIIS